MKRYFLTTMLIILTLICCQRDDEETQVIDQVLKLYMKNSDGQDLLNPSIKGSYSTPTLLDLLGQKDLQVISGYTFLKDADTIVYMDYAAGAVRRLRDSISPQQKTYYSKFVIRLPKTINEVVVNDNDTIEIEYNWTPSLFQISKLWYNDKLKFTKAQGQPNIVTIVK